MDGCMYVQFVCTVLYCTVHTNIHTYIHTYVYIHTYLTVTQHWAGPRKTLRRHAAVKDHRHYNFAFLCLRSQLSPPHRLDLADSQMSVGPSMEDEPSSRETRHDLDRSCTVYVYTSRHSSWPWAVTHAGQSTTCLGRCTHTLAGTRSPARHGHVAAQRPTGQTDRQYRQDCCTVVQYSTVRSCPFVLATPSAVTAIASSRASSALGLGETLSEHQTERERDFVHLDDASIRCPSSANHKPPGSISSGPSAGIAQLAQ